jgi:hypothetical protein
MNEVTKNTERLLLPGDRFLTATATKRPGEEPFFSGALFVSIR